MRRCRPEEKAEDLFLARRAGITAAPTGGLRRGGGDRRTSRHRASRKFPAFEARMTEVPAAKTREADLHEPSRLFPPAMTAFSGKIDEADVRRQLLLLAIELSGRGPTRSVAARFPATDRWSIARRIPASNSAASPARPTRPWCSRLAAPVLDCGGAPSDAADSRGRPAGWRISRSRAADRDRWEESEGGRTRWSRRRRIRDPPRCLPITDAASALPAVRPRR